MFGVGQLGRTLAAKLRGRAETYKTQAGGNRQSPYLMVALALQEVAAIIEESVK